jgi:hypothetical protein
VFDPHRRVESFSMDLQTFVSRTLIAIIEGVKEAQEKYPAGSGSAAINHVDRSGTEAELPYDATAVSFDVAVTSESESTKNSQKKGGLNIKVVDASLGASNATRERNEAISRVAFSVPVNLPVTHTSQLHDERERENQETTRKMRELGSRLA